MRLKDLFRQRLKEEMENQGVSANALADRCKRAGHDIGQTTISTILRGKYGASLSNIEALADGLGVPAWFLFTDAKAVEQRVIKPPSGAPQRVSRLPDSYPKIFAPDRAKKARAKSRQ